MRRLATIGYLGIGLAVVFACQQSDPTSPLPNLLDTATPLAGTSVRSTWYVNADSFPYDDGCWGGPGETVVIPISGSVSNTSVADGAGGWHTTTITNIHGTGIGTLGSQFNLNHNDTWTFQIHAPYPAVADTNGMGLITQSNHGVIGYVHLRFHQTVNAKGVVTGQMIRGNPSCHP
jgi:hypothetical protein